MNRDQLLADVAAQLWEYGQRANQNTDDVKAILAPFLAAWDAAAEYKIPGPYDIAMAFGPAALISGKAENIGAAMSLAWAAVPQFYQGRDFYLRDIAPIMYGAASPPEGALDADDDATG